MAYVQGAEKSLEERREHCKLLVLTSFCSAADILQQTSKSSKHLRVRLPFSAAPDVLLTFAGPVTVAISTAADSGSYQETRNAAIEAKDPVVKDCLIITEQLTRQILGELDATVGALNNFSSGKNVSCIS